MIEGYCRVCSEFIPLAIDHMHKVEHTDEIAWNLICPQCFLLITTLKIDDVGLYVLQEGAELASHTPAPIADMEENIQQGPATARSQPASPRLRLVP